MGKRISGRDVQTRVGDLVVVFEEVTLSIEDGSKAVTSGGRPNGFVRGMLAASGELTVDTANLNVIVEAARVRGSIQELPLFDLVFNAETADDELTIECFDNLIKFSEVLNASSTGEDKLTHKIPFEVTGKEFVRINGVPYAPNAEIEALR